VELEILMLLRTVIKKRRSTFTRTFRELDEVTTDLAVKKYLEDNGIKVIEAQIKQ